MFSSASPTSPRGDPTPSSPSLEDGELRDGGLESSTGPHDRAADQRTALTQFLADTVLQVPGSQSWTKVAAPPLAFHDAFQGASLLSHRTPLGDLTNTSMAIAPSDTVDPSAIMKISALTQPNDNAALQRTDPEDPVLCESGQRPHVDESGYDSGSTDDSEQPLEAGSKKKRRKFQLSPSPQIKSEPKSAPAFPPSTKTLFQKLPGGQEKYQFDQERVDRCDCCEREDIRCYNKAGALRTSTSCHNCFVRHWTCTMDGKRCSRVSTSSGSTRQKAKYKPSKTTPAVQSKANFSLPPATTTRSGRSQKIAQHAPVLLCPPPMRSRKNKTKATTKLTIKVPRKTNTSTPAAPSSDAALPGDEEDHLTSASSDEATGGQGSSSSAVTPTAALQSSPRSIEEIAEAVTRPSLGVTAQPTQIVAQPSRSSTAQEGGGQNDPNKTTSVSMETADAPSKSTPNPQLEKFTVGLVKDIEASIKSCQDRIASSPDQVGLMALSVTSSVLIKDIDKALTSYDSALDSANPRHFILPKLKENLEQIQEGCERARDAFKDEKMDANERLARQLEPVLMSDVVFGRCLTLISMHVEEESA